MAIRDLFFRISAKDDTSEAFAAVGRKLKDVDGAARSMMDRLESAGRSMRNVGGVMTAAVSAPLALAARSMLAAFQGAEKAQKQLEQAIRTTGGAAGFTAAELSKHAASLQEMSSIDGDAILADVTNQLLTFGSISGDVFLRAQTAALDLSATLGSNLRSQTIQLGKALNDPVKGLSALGDAGIQFTEQQKAVIKGLVETGRVAEAQGVILDEIAAFYGGQASASAASLTGQLAALSNAWGDLQEQFGAIIAEFLPLVIAGLRSVIAAVQEMPAPMQRFVVIGGLLAAALGPAIAALGLFALGITAVGAPVALAIAGVAALAAGVAAFWPEITAAATAVRDGFGAAVTGLQGMAAAAVAHVQSMVAGFLAANPQLVALYDTVSGVFDDMATAVGDAGRDAKAAVADMVQGIWSYLTNGFDKAKVYVQQTVEDIAASFKWLYDDVVGHSTVPDLVDGVLDEFVRMDRGAGEGAKDTAGTVSEVFDNLGAQVVRSFETMARDGEFSLRGLAQAAMGIGSSIAGGIANKGVGLLADMAGTALSGYAMSAFGGASTAAPAGWTPQSASSFGLPKLNEGADFTVGGRGGIDRNLVSFMATRGERVSVTPRNGGGGAGVTVNIQTPSPEAFHKSRAQIAATVSRAAARGNRNL